MDDYGFQKTLEQALKLWILPETERRRRDGILPSNFILRRAQVVFASPIDGGGITVRLNEEVRVSTKVKTSKRINEGEIVYMKDIADVERIELMEEEKDSAHFTVFRFQDQWIVAFDFRYNQRRAKHHLEVAKQFLEMTRLSYQRRLWNPFLDNLFSAAELIAKAQLLIIPYGKIKTHRRIQSLYTLHARLGNVSSHHKDALCKLAGERTRARYLKSPFSLDEEQATSYLRTVEEMLDYCLSLLKTEPKS